MSRWLFASILLIIAAAFLYTYLAKKELGFDPIQELPNEVLMMENEGDLESLDLKSSNPTDLDSFFSKQKDLHFTPFLLKVPSQWEIQGVSIIDYDFVKIAMTRFHKTDQKDLLFHFTLSGHIEDLSASSKRSIDHFLYQAYSSDQLNLIAWQHDPHTISILVGHLSAEDLAHIAANSGSAF